MFVAALLAGCGAGDEDACPAYACVNTGTLTGTVSLAGSRRLDVRLCEDDTCLMGSIDLDAPKSGRTCAQWSLSEVCLSEGSTSGSFSVTARYFHETDEMPEGEHTLELTLTDGQTGASLVSESRAIEYEVTREDSCHRCFAAEASL